MKEIHSSNMEKEKLLNGASDSVANETTDDDQHETPEEYKSRWRTIRIVYSTLALSAMEHSAIYSSVWPHLKKVDQEVNAQFLGLVVGGYSIFQVIGSVVLGAWCQYRPAIEPLLAGASLRFIGNVIYVCAENYPGYDGKMLILLARITVGFSAGDLLKPNLRAALVTIIAFFVILYNVSTIQTMTNPLLGDEFALRKDEAVLFRERTILLTGSFITLVAFVVLLPWGSERPILQSKDSIVVGNISKIVLSPGCPIKYNWCKTTPKIRSIQFAIGVFFAFVGYAMSRIVTYLLYSKIIGPRKQGLYMAFFSCAGSFGDFAAPLLTTSLYAHFGPRGLFLCAAIVNLISATMLAGFQTILVPFEEYIKVPIAKE
eukprot:gene4346-20563_t